MIKINILTSGFRPVRESEESQIQDTIDHNGQRKNFSRGSQKCSKAATRRGSRKKQNLAFDMTRVFKFGAEKPRRLL